MRKVTAVATLLVLFSALVPSVRASAPAEVSGSIRNGTRGAAIPPGLVVTAIQLGVSDAEVDRRQVTASPDGVFRIEDFDLDRGSRFIVGTDYLTVTYSTFADAQHGPAKVKADLVIYEQTDDETVIRVNSDVITVVEGDGGTLEVIQLMRVGNTSDRTFVGRTPPRESQNAKVLIFPVSSGGFDVVPMEGLTSDRLLAVPQGFTSADPIPPGEVKVSFLYKVRVPRSGWSFERAVLYPTERADILVGPGLKVSSSEFTFSEEVTLAEKRYRRYRGEAFEAGEVMTASIASDAGAGSGIWWGLGTGLAMAAAGAGALRFRRRRRPLRPTTEDREWLVEEIAVLDEAFERGRIGEKAYERERGRLKRRLEEMTDSLASADRG